MRVVLQNVLDGLVLNLLPFGLIMGTWQLLKKKVSPIVVVLLLMAIGIIEYYLNILGLGV
ncbi:PTS system mannose/fructose/sorbose family transporter subunit IID [Hominiventricola filiformis]|uniref:PTS system mannose/fructose/sorbose family transporter subunit IID n=1 Tax=Hominiventricola filiformis TaxID=2885352 RepID=A0AAE3DCB6_9FIRM|nr:PTS system mannose/fructose/sorbose family transporter subunit IID [Hominiventricola filiformis]MCC2126199.1 PTS system mannose/fructose/sorbose family transporter subunit IID [Hominiventricola filiformis]